MRLHICPHWRRRIAAAKKRGKFTVYEKNLSGSFQSCAIGERFALTSDDSGGFFEDSTGNALGLSFMYAVHGNNIVEATRLLRQIERFHTQEVVHAP